MDLVSWEEVLLNDKIRTDDAEMRAELEVRHTLCFCGQDVCIVSKPCLLVRPYSDFACRQSLRTRLNNELEARSQLFRHRRQQDCLRVQRRMDSLLLRTAFREWSSVVQSKRMAPVKDPDMSMHGSQIQVFAEKSRMLVEELRSLMTEWHKDEIKSEGNTTKKVTIPSRFASTLAKRVEPLTQNVWHLAWQMLVSRYRQELSNLVEDYLEGIKAADIVQSNVDETAIIS
jgi:hypothetical protein